MDIYDSMTNANIGATWNKIIIPGALMLTMTKVESHMMMIQYVNFIDMYDNTTKVVRTTTTVTTTEACMIYESFEKDELTCGE